MGTGGTQQTTGTLQDADDIYYEDDDEESENNGLVPVSSDLVVLVLYFLNSWVK